MAVETLVSPAATRVRKVDLRIVAGVFLMILAIAANSALIRKAQDRTAVLVAAKAIQPGEVISASDLREADVSVAAGLDFLPASASGSLIGQVATEPITPGELIGRGSLAKIPPLPAGFVAMSAALKPERAAAGDLRPGDRVAVITSTSPDHPDARTTILLTDVEVLSSRRTRTSEGDGVIVVLKIRLEEARSIAEAQAAGTIQLVLLSAGGPK
jgi:Flp pilus assembly protein CpaB